MELDGYNIIGGGTLFSVPISMIEFLADKTISYSASVDCSVMNPLATNFQNEDFRTQVAGKLLMIDAVLESNANVGTVSIQWLKNSVLVGTAISWSAAETGRKFIVQEIDFSVDDLLEIRLILGGAGAIKFDKLALIMNMDDVA